MEMQQQGKKSAQQDDPQYQEDEEECDEEDEDRYDVSISSLAVFITVLPACCISSLTHGSTLKMTTASTIWRTASTGSKLR
jgi:hypothetical protein